MQRWWWLGLWACVLLMPLDVRAQVPAITSPLTATGVVGTAFTYQITATNTPTSYSAASLPAGLSVNTATGLISGTPTAAGTASVTISATNGMGTGSATLALTMIGTLTVREIPFGGVNTTGKAISSCWGGLGKDTSNRLYFALGIGTPNSDDVAIFQYTPVTGGAIGTRTFLDTLKHVTQLENNFDTNETIAKVHTDIRTLGGLLYFASHDFHDVSPGYHRGGHFFSYDPAANHFTDLSKTDPGGVSTPGQGIIGFDLLLPQQKLVGFTYGPDGGGDVVAYDLATHTSVYWQGNPNPDLGVSRRIFSSNDNLVYISYGQSAGPQQIYALNITNGAITAPAGMTLRLAQLISTAHASDNDRVWLLNWDSVYLWHTASKQFEALGELFPPADVGRNLLAANFVLSADETKLYTLAEGYIDSGPTYVWRLYQFDVATHTSLLLADLTSQMMTINGGTLGGAIGAVLDAQGRFYTCGSEGFVLEISGLPAPAPPPPTQSAWWRFDANTGTTAIDSTGNGHTVTLGAGATWGAPKVGAASLRCTGATQPPSVADAGFTPSTYSWLTWIKGDVTPATTGFSSPFADGPTNAGTDAWGLWWNSTDPASTQAVFHRDNAGGHTLKIPITLAANTWYHLAVTFDGTTLRLYVNGQPSSTLAVAAPVAPSGPFQVCGRYFQTPWAGMLDELRVDSQVWTAAQILAEYNLSASRHGNWHRMLAQ